MLGATVMAAVATTPAVLRDQSCWRGAAGAPRGHGQPGEATGRACLAAWGELGLAVWVSSRTRPPGSSFLHRDFLHTMVQDTQRRLGAAQGGSVGHGLLVLGLVGAFLVGSGTWRSRSLCPPPLIAPLHPAAEPRLAEPRAPVPALLTPALRLRVAGESIDLRLGQSREGLRAGSAAPFPVQ